MAKKQTNTATVTKSDTIRELLKTNRKATAKEIQAALADEGIEASIALISKVKASSKGRGRRKATGRRRRGGRVIKAVAIRNMFDKLGRRARVRDVVAALKTEGIAVSSAQVSTLRSKLPSNGPLPAVGSAAVPFEHLLAAKQLAAELGGIEEAQRALDSFARLLEA